MGFKGRLDKLEPVTCERWLRSWEAFFKVLFDRHLPEAVQERFTAVADRAARDEPYGDELDAAVQRLDYGLEAWFERWDVPDLEAGRDYHNTPDTIPTPPSEPEGKHQELTALLTDEGTPGDAAALLLYMLASARAVRDYRRL